MIAAAIGAIQLVAATGAAAANEVAVSSAKTVVVHDGPVGPRGHLRKGFTVVRRYGGGQCWRNSSPNGTRAYRCSSANGQIEDPCWVQNVPGSYVICQFDPWNKRVWRIHVTKGFDHGAPVIKRPFEPWGLNTDAGAHFSFLQGGTGGAGRFRVNYASPNPHNDVFLAGNVNKDHPRWRIRTAKLAGPDHYVLTGWTTVTKAWYGRTSLRDKSH